MLWDVHFIPISSKLTVCIISVLLECFLLSRTEINHNRKEREVPGCRCPQSMARIPNIIAQFAG